MRFTATVAVCLICFFFHNSVYGTQAHTFQNASLNATAIQTALITTTHISEYNPLSYFTNQSFSSENLTSFVLSDLNSLDGIKVTLNGSLMSENYSIVCSSALQCSDLPVICMVCDLSNDCVYGHKTSVNCHAKEDVLCTGPKQFTKIHECRYCYQTPAGLHICTNSTSCRANVYPRQRYLSNCTVPSNVLCLGNRKFLKMRNCNWTSGKRWRTALFLSITLGGLGAERFYLGQWREGLGKLFSFGGLGVWTLVDVVLVATGYLTPSDGSLYI